MNTRLITLLCILICIITSCANKKDVIYFQGETDLNTLYEQYVPRIQSNDMLTITVSAADIKATEPFNQQSVYMSGQMGNPSNPYRNIYTVSEKGTIDFPVLGQVKLGGLTRNEAINHIKLLLDDYIVDPGVNISFTNFKVSVLGEVARPGSFTLPNERITLLEALALAGDLTINGIRKDVEVIREVNGEKKRYSIDLTSPEVLNSPVYYLAQNDIIYVKPNQAKIQTSSGINYPVFVSMAGLIITVISVLTR